MHRVAKQKLTEKPKKKKCPRINWNLFCLLSVFFSWLLNYLSSLGTIEDINYKMIAINIEVVAAF